MNTFAAVANNDVVGEHWFVADDGDQEVGRLPLAGVAEGLGGPGGGQEIGAVQCRPGQARTAGGEQHAHRLNAAVAPGLGDGDFEQAWVLILEFEVLDKPDEVGGAAGLFEHLEHALPHGRVGVQVHPFQPRQGIHGQREAIGVGVRRNHGPRERRQEAKAKGGKEKGIHGEETPQKI